MSTAKRTSKRSATRGASKVRPTKVEKSAKSRVHGKAAVDGASSGDRKRSSKFSFTAATTPAPYGVRASSKLATVISMLQQKGGATIEALRKATGWQAHSVRGALSGSLKKKLGLTVTSDKAAGVRTYRIAD